MEEPQAEPTEDRPALFDAGTSEQTIDVPPGESFPMPMPPGAVPPPPVEVVTFDAEWWAKLVLMRGTVEETASAWAEAAEEAKSAKKAHDAARDAFEREFDRFQRRECTLPLFDQAAANQVGSIVGSPLTAEEERALAEPPPFEGAPWQHPTPWNELLAEAATIEFAALDFSLEPFTTPCIVELARGAAGCEEVIALSPIDAQPPVSVWRVPPHWLMLMVPGERYSVRVREFENEAAPFMGEEVEPEFTEAERADLNDETKDVNPVQAAVDIAEGRKRGRPRKTKPNGAPEAGE